jgi:hypothetical protein
MRNWVFFFIKQIRKIIKTLKLFRILEINKCLKTSERYLFKESKQKQLSKNELCVPLSSLLVLIPLLVPALQKLLKQAFAITVPMKNHYPSSYWKMKKRF